MKVWSWEYIEHYEEKNWIKSTISQKYKMCNIAALNMGCNKCRIHLFFLMPQWLLMPIIRSCPYTYSCCVGPYTTEKVLARDIRFSLTNIWKCSIMKTLFLTNFIPIPHVTDLLLVVPTLFDIFHPPTPHPAPLL